MLVETLLMVLKCDGFAGVAGPHAHVHTHTYTHIQICAHPHSTPERCKIRSLREEETPREDCIYLQLRLEDS